MKGRLTRRMLSASGLLALVIAAAFAVLVTEVREQHESARLERRGAEVSAAATTLEALAVDLQTGSRGFAITGDERFLEPYEEAREEIPAQARELERLILDPGQKERARELATAIRSYDDDVASLVIGAARSDPARAQALVAAGEGKRRMDAIRAQFAAFQDAQAELAAEREARARADERQAIAVGLGGLGLSVLLILAFAAYLSRAIVAPVRRVAQCARLLASGDLSARAPERGKGEVADLGRAFNTMAVALQESRDELESQNAELEVQTAELEDRQAQLETANEELEAQRTELEQAHGELSSEKERIDSFYRFGEMIASTTGSEPLGPQILREVADLLDADVGALYAVTADKEDLRLSATRGLERALIADRVAPGEGLPGRAVAELRPLTASHPGSGLSLPAFGEGVALRHELHVPLFQADDVVGLLTLGRVADRPFSREDVETVEHLTRQSAIRISNLVAYERAEKLADINRTVLDATKEAIVLVDLEGEIVLANAAAERMGELHGVKAGGNARDLAASIRDRTTDPEAYWAALQAGLSDPEHMSVMEYELADSGRSFQRYTAPVRNASGTPIGRITTLREITSEREADRLKSELVATVSHELRTPLAGILGFSELLVARDLDETTRAQYAHTIHAEAQRLTVLINDFLDLQRIEEGSFTLALEPVAVGELVREQTAVFAGQSAEHRVKVRVTSEPLTVLGDADRLNQVVANLISNAIKYSPDGGEVEISVERRRAAVRVNVRDQGLGIPADQQRRLFEKFFRVETAERRAIGGTGLGLALSREIVEAHGGRIGFESVEGEGSTFWFELPASHQGGDHSRGRVLVIEDDPTAASLLAAYLTEDGYSVEISATGEQGLERVLEDPPMLVCLDIRLPGELDGWQVLARLKEHPATRSVPVIVCTGRNGRQRAASLGAADFITKPFSAERLREAVARVLPGGGGSVLVVDDEEAVRALVRETLKGNGFELREAADGDEALATVSQRPPDAIVLDLIMPGLDGFAVLERLQGDPVTRSIPVIVLTARRLSPEERALLSKRAVSLLEKSDYSARELRELVGRAVGAAAAG